MTEIDKKMQNMDSSVDAMVAIRNLKKLMLESLLIAADDIIKEGLLDGDDVKDVVRISDAFTRLYEARL